jgi:NAD(P)-dependent dehydrogenase (short-subunit alcohol dehydrogenase family)
MTCPELRTEEGFEMQIGTNHFGHFLLTNLLMPLLKKAAPGARIVNVSSLAHEQGQIFWDDMNFERSPYDPIKAYSQSKLANVLFTKELARRNEGSGVTAYALHPGVIHTELGRHLKDTFGTVAFYLTKPFFYLCKLNTFHIIYANVLVL